MKFNIIYFRKIVFLFLTGILISILFIAGKNNHPDQLTKADKFTFAIIGDRTGEGPDSWKILDRSISELNQLQPDFAIMIGDLIEGAGSNQANLVMQWQEGLSHLDSLKVPVFLVPGNHDICNKISYLAWKEHIGDTYFAFTYHQCRFVILNTEEGQGTGEMGLGADQMAFLKREIQNPSYQHLFLLMHQPMWILNNGLGQQWNEIEILLGNRSWSVIAGHLHMLAAKRENGRLYLIHGPTGGRMRMDRNPALGLFHHITLVTVDKGQPKVAFIEPGRIYGETTALQAYQRGLQSMKLLQDQSMR